MQLSVSNNTIIRGLNKKTSTVAKVKNAGGTAFTLTDEQGHVHVLLPGDFVNIALKKGQRLIVGKASAEVVK